MKKVISLVLAIVLLMFSQAAFAQSAQPSSKEEAVYGLLSAEGKPESVYVVNMLTGGGDLTDYGDYTAVENLTDASPLTQTDGKVTLQTSAKRFYYQGTLANAQLPWTVKIAYTLNGQPVSAEDLAGKSGSLTLHLTVAQNPDAKATFFLNDALQITVTLDPALCDDIQADQATVAEAAGKKQLSFTVLPGQGADVTVSAAVHDFAMDSITLAGVRMNLDAQSAAITKLTAQLTDAVASLDDGAGQLQTGADSLSSGLTQYLSGVKALTDGLSQLANGATSLKDGAASLKDGAGSLTAQNETLMNAALALRQSTFDAVNAQLQQSVQKLPTLTPENYAQLLENVPALAQVKAQLDGITQFVTGLQSYTDGVSQLSTGASTLSSGADQLSTSLSGLPDSAATLTASATELQTGSDGLSGGLTDYKAGTAKLRTGLSDGAVSDALGGLYGNGDPVTSFVSDQNTNVTAVQFALKTAAIKAPEALTETEPEAAPTTFWQKLTALFGF